MTRKMTRGNPRIRVKRRELIEIVRKRRAKMVDDHKRVVAQHPQKLEDWRANVAKLLRKAADDAERGKIPITKYGEVNLKLPAQPTMPTALNTCQIDRMLKTLAIGVDETISLSAEEADYYFGPCPL